MTTSGLHDPTRTGWERLKWWFYMRPFWCRLDGHQWQWQPGSRPTCAVCHRTMTADQVADVIRHDTQVWMRKEDA